MRRHHESYFVSKLVVITGGTSGIGLALARELGGLGARVVVLADKADSVARASADFSALGITAHAYVCDIGMPGSVTDTCRHVVAAHGAPDILINNAGFAIYRTFEQENPAEVERLMSVNFAGAIRVTKAFVGAMIGRRSGQIVNVASIAGMLPMTPCAIYSAAKHGMVGWSQCLAPELARFGIAVTMICPGRIETPFFDHDTFKQRPHRKETETTIPMQTVVKATLDAILKRQRIRYVPRRYGILAWLYQVFGPFARRPFDRLMRSRIEDLYRQ